MLIWPGINYALFFFWNLFSFRGLTDITTERCKKDGSWSTLPLKNFTNKKYVCYQSVHSRGPFSLFIRKLNGRLYAVCSLLSQAKLEIPWWSQHLRLISRPKLRRRLKCWSPRQFQRSDSLWWNRVNIDLPSRHTTHDVF